MTKPVIQNDSDAVAEMSAEMRQAEQEEVWVLCLNSRHEMISKKMVFRGAVDHCAVDMRSLFREAVRSSAHAIVMLHNHPNGDPEPSEPDIDMAQRVIQCASILDLGFVDSIVVTADAHQSVRLFIHNKVSGEELTNIDYENPPKVQITPDDLSGALINLLRIAGKGLGHDEPERNPAELNEG